MPGRTDIRRASRRLNAARCAGTAQEDAVEDWEAFTRGSFSQQMVATKHVLNQLVAHPAKSAQWDAERVTVHTIKRPTTQAVPSGSRVSIR